MSEISDVNSPAVNYPTETPETPNPQSYIPLLRGDVQLIVTPHSKGHIEFLQGINKTVSGDVIRMASFI